MSRTQPILKGRDRPRRVLVVDDDQEMAHLLVDLLRLGGHDARAVFNGAQALHVLAGTEADFDVLLCDVVMPGHHGADVAAETSLLRPDTAFVFMSGSSDPALLRRLPAGWPVLRKPFAGAELLAALRLALEPATRAVAG